MSYCAKPGAVHGDQEVGLVPAGLRSCAGPGPQVWMFVQGKGEPSISCSLIHSRRSLMSHLKGKSREIFTQLTTCWREKHSEEGIHCSTCTF